MKKIISAIIVQFMVISAMAQTVTFKLNDGIDDGALKTSIESNISALLTEFGASLRDGRALELSGINMTENGKKSVEMLWSNLDFEAIDNVIVEKLLNTSTGYQVRNIPLAITATNSEKISGSDSYQEGVIDLDRNGAINSLYFSINPVTYMEVMRSAGDVTDTRRRQMILDYVEHFRTAYNQKDINFLQQVFSDDAIIITGKVTTTKPTDINILPTNKITYNVQGKKEYLSRLQRVFNANKHINVKFSEIKIKRHPTKADYYGVLLHQGYSSDIYSDEGYVYLVWDFRNEDAPQIHVRTWQPHYMDENKTQTIKEEEIFDITSFEL